MKERSPTRDEARTVAAAPGSMKQERGESPDFRGDGCATQAALTIEGESYATAFLDRLRAGSAQPDELATLVGFLTGPMLSGFCSLLAKALRGSP